MITQLSYYVLILKSYFVEEDGQDLMGQALSAGLLALAPVAGLLAMSGTLETMWNNLSGALGEAAGG